ncbi:type VI secretion system protein TssA [Noviherbaspirillum denitrificans]|uniref:ImpA N-terminal domain-containing protein n=1 Tax=Noviherbaspirillum denitrificans TaxID=1968433 RepID=A0A254T8W0_9BURK|nr:type VI secretion system protein TssA [Noviherbaspirillum denitrificans]OWW19074.1 hypothetical protein AYR66_05775 [Noviherbaspirillum denitrificans]
MDQALFNQLVAPIPGDHPGGEDMTFSPQFDVIREARRQDDASLSQGEWETVLKSSEWPKVRLECETLLSGKSKDLQVACWYTEALCHLSGFAGLAFGVQVLEIMLTDFWEFLYPDLLEDGLDERAGKIEWLNRQLPSAIRAIPLTEKTVGSYSWLLWDQSRSVDNLGLKDPAARDAAVADGKLTGDAFDKAATQSGLSFYKTLHEHIQDASTRLASLERHVDARFGNDSPGLKELRQAVSDCDEVVTRIIARLGGAVPVENGGRVVAETTGSGERPAGAAPGAVPVGMIQSRTDAVNALRHVSHYFRHNEPHSPVALLAERAAKWAEMPLERWLAAVIKDDSTLTQLRELLDIRPEG